MKGQIFICTAIMLNDHSNPYIESTTVLSDIYILVVRRTCPKCTTCFFFSDISIFLRRQCYTRFFFSGISIFHPHEICMVSSAKAIGVYRCC